MSISSLPRFRRLWVGIGFVLATLGLIPAVASGYGTVLPEDETTNYDFGWSAARQSLGGQPEPIVLQYDYDYDLEPEVPQSLRETCNRSDKLDEPVRAFTFKNANGQRRVQLGFPRAPQNRRMIGRDLRDARRENSPTIAAPDFSPEERRICGLDISFFGQSNPFNWREFDDVEWLDGLYYVPGDSSVPNSGDVYAAMHQEARQTFGSNFCTLTTDPNDPARNCWFGSVTYARSTGPSTCRTPEPPPTTPNAIGACYSHHANYSPGNPATLSDHLIGTIPYPYENNWGRRGYNEHSSIVRGVGNGPDDATDKYFMLALVSAPATTQGGVVNQVSGVCVLRTDNISQPSSWRAWDGDGFDVHPESSENLVGSPDDHLCKPVGVPGTPWSLTYNTYLKKYMALGTASIDGITGVYYTLSDDLRNWGDPQRLMEAPTRNNVGLACAAGTLNEAPDDGVTYPVLLDPNDPAKDWPSATSINPNFERPGARPDLYSSHKDVILNDPDDPSQGCHEDEGVDSHGEPWDAANIARLPIDFRPQRQATLNGVLQDATNGYDFNDSLSSGCSLGSYDIPDAGEPAGCASANLFPPSWSTSAYGLINTKWEAGNDVWYGSAFHLPSNFFALNGGRLIKWSGASNTYGALTLNGATDELRLVRGRTGSGAEELPLVSFGGVPTNQWVWLEVHQKLSSAAGSALTEVFMNGHLVGSSATPNIYSDTGTISSALFGAAELTTSTPLVISMGIDRSTLLGGQRGAVGAPITPIGLRKATGTQKTLTWNTTGASSYRIYKRGTDGTWMQITETSTTSYIDPGFSCPGAASYRVTSVSGSKESNVTTPFQMEC
jgi:hypothetical protein